MQPAALGEMRSWNLIGEVGAKAYCASFVLKNLTPLPFTARLMYGTLAGGINSVFKMGVKQSGTVSETLEGKLLLSISGSCISWGIAAQVLRAAERQAPRHFSRVSPFAGMVAACTAELGALFVRSLGSKPAVSSSEPLPLTPEERQIILELYKRVDA